MPPAYRSPHGTTCRGAAVTPPRVYLPSTSTGHTRRTLDIYHIRPRRLSPAGPPPLLPPQVPYLSQIVPAFLHMTRRSDSEARRRAFHQISKFIDIFGAHMRPFLGDIVGCVMEYWLPVAPALAASGGPARFTPKGLHQAVGGVCTAFIRP